MRKSDIYMYTSFDSPRASIPYLAVYDCDAITAFINAIFFAFVNKNYIRRNKLNYLCLSRDDTEKAAPHRVLVPAKYA